jgi:hypothetical protein
MSSGSYFLVDGVQFLRQRLELRPEVMKDVLEMAGQRKSVMDRLGIAATILEGVLQVVGVVQDVSFKYLLVIIPVFHGREAPSCHQDYARECHRCHQCQSPEKMNLADHAYV